MSGLTNIYLQNILHNILHLKYFKGVFSSNTIPSYLLLPTKHNKYTFIINYDVQQGPGTHFAAIMATRDKIYVYDSLAMDISFAAPSFVAHCQQLGRKVKQVFAYQLQSTQSLFCGIYAMTMCVMLDYDYCSNKGPVEMFYYGPDTTKMQRGLNDKIALHYLLHAINTLYRS